MTTISEPALATVWHAVVGEDVRDDYLGWPPDVFAVTDVILGRTEAYRFALSSLGHMTWPPDGVPDWADAVVESGRRWSAWVDNPAGPLPALLADEWQVFRSALQAPASDVSEAHDPRYCQAILTLHAIADEACAGLGVALDTSTGDGLSYRAQGRELLVRTGSLARFPTRMIRVLPRLRTPPTSSSVRSLSRYATVHTPGVELRWHKAPSSRSRRQATDVDISVAYLLLPWPMRVRESDFHPLPETVHAHNGDRSGFFEFLPADPLDLDLVDRMIVAALDEVPRLDVVMLPEGAIDVDEIDGLLRLLHRHGVVGLIAGVRGRREDTGRFPGNWVHLAVSVGDHWTELRQAKHHRWSLDEAQVDQYHLGGALHPHVRWWEAMEIPPRNIHLVDVGEGSTIVSLVCEDLAQIDDVADVIRSVGPAIVVTPLLDGPQLGARWSARYASVLADDPGSAVLTLTSYGMAQRSRPAGHAASPVVALWKDPGRGLQEIALDAGAMGILLSASTDRSPRRCFDGRRPVDNGSELVDVSVYQVRPAATGSPPPDRAVGPDAPAELTDADLTILTSWAEAVADAVAFAPERLDDLRRLAFGEGEWRAMLGLPEPTGHLASALHDMFAAVSIGIAGGAPDLSILALLEREPGRSGVQAPTRRILRSVLEQRRARQGQGE